MGFTLDQFSQITSLSRNAISRVERDHVQHIEPRIVGRILPHLTKRLNEAFPEGDAYEFLIPSNTLGSWMRNQRLRHAMGLKQLAKTLRVNPFTVARYEQNRSNPTPRVQQRLKQLFGNGFEKFLKGSTIQLPPKDSHVLAQGAGKQGLGAFLVALIFGA